MEEAKFPINYYKCFFRDSWCIISFRYSDAVLADRIIKSLIRCGVVWKRIGEEYFLAHTLVYFASFRLGALRFDVGSRDPVRYRSFFYSRLVDCYDFSLNYALCAVHPGIVLPLSTKKENI